MKKDELALALSDVHDEVVAVNEEFPPFNSAHEGLGVLMEEFDELKEHVYKKQKNRDIPAMRREAIQVAAVAIRFVLSVCDEERGRR